MVLVLEEVFFLCLQESEADERTDGQMDGWTKPYRFDATDTNKKAFIGYLNSRS